MKQLLPVLAALIVGCSGYNRRESSPPTGVIGRQEATDIAKREIARRKITLPPGATMKVEQGTVMVEVGPDIPIYVVSFYAPDRRKSRALYVVSVDRRNGRIEDFTDTRTLIRAGPVR